MTAAKKMVTIIAKQLLATMTMDNMMDAIRNSWRGRPGP